METESIETNLHLEELEQPEEQFCTCDGEFAFDSRLLDGDHECLLEYLMKSALTAVKLDLDDSPVRPRNFRGPGALFRV